MAEEPPQPYSGGERRNRVRRSIDALDGLDAAIARLARFRATWETGDQIDEFSELTGADLDLILAQLSWPEGELGNPRTGGE